MSFSRERNMLLRFFLTLALVSCGVDARAEDKKDEKRTEAPAPPKEQTVATQGAIKIDGKEISYNATAGTLPLLDDAGKPTAHVFFVAYTKNGDDSNKRPITFTFNGGPG